MTIKDCNKFFFFNDAVSVLIDRFENFHKMVLISGGIELRCDVSVDDSFEFIFEMERLQIVDNFCLDLLFGILGKSVTGSQQPFIIENLFCRDSFLWVFC